MLVTHTIVHYTSISDHTTIHPLGHWYSSKVIGRTLLKFRLGKNWDLRILDPEDLRNIFQSHPIEEHSPAYMDYYAGKFILECQTSSIVPYLPFSIHLDSLFWPIMSGSLRKYSWDHRSHDPAYKKLWYLIYTTFPLSKSYKK